MRVIAIDPSINDCGLAVFVDKTLLNYKLIHPDKKYRENEYTKSYSVFQQVKDHVLCDMRVLEVGDVLVLEIPEYWDTAGWIAREAGTIVKLSFLCGMICTLQDQVNLVTTTPSNWKKQLKKKVMAKRLEKLELYPDIDFMKLNHNVADAIGLGHWYLYGRV
jgi:hypothetical protein